MRIFIERNPIPIRPLLAISALLILAGCAGAPPETELPEPSPAPAGPSTAELFADANLLAQNGRYGEAADKLETLVTGDGDNIAALRLLASVYTAMDEKQKATGVWERVSALDPADPDAAYETGITAARKGDWTTAREKMSAVEAAGASTSKHHLLLGEANLELGYKGEAERYLKRAADLERAGYLLGKLFYDRGRLAEAEAQFEAVLARNPKNAPAHLHLGWMHYRRGNKRTALHHYEQSVAGDPRDPLARLSLAALLEEMKRRKPATDHYIAALGLPGIPRAEKKKAYNSTSRLLVAADRLDEAIDLIRRGLREFPSAGGLHFQWGEVLLRRGDKTGAKGKYKQAANDPTWKDVALKRLHSIR